MNLEVVQCIVTGRGVSNDKYLSVFVRKLMKTLEDEGHNISYTFNSLNKTTDEDNSIKFHGYGKAHRAHRLFKEYEDILLFEDFVFLIDKETEQFVLLDFQDGSKPSKVYGKHPNFIGCIQSFYLSGFNQNYCENYDRFIPGLFFPQVPRLIKEYYKEISTIKPTDKRLFFAGTIGYENGYQKADGNPRREIVLKLKEKYPDEIRYLDRNEKLPRVDWYRESAKHFINLSLAGAPWCSREFEFWGLGLPFIAPQWQNPLLNNPVPNYHYLACDGGEMQENGVCIDTEYVVEKIYERYKKAIDKPEYLKWIGANGKKFYDDNIDLKNSVNQYKNIILNFFNIAQWI